MLTVLTPRSSTISSASSWPVSIRSFPSVSGSTSSSSKSFFSISTDSPPCFSVSIFPRSTSVAFAFPPVFTVSWSGSSHRCLFPEWNFQPQISVRDSRLSDSLPNVVQTSTIFNYLMNWKYTKGTWKYELQNEIKSLTEIGNNTESVRFKTSSSGHLSGFDQALLQTYCSNTPLKRKWSVCFAFALNFTPSQDATEFYWEPNQANVVPLLHKKELFRKTTWTCDWNRGLINTEEKWNWITWLLRIRSLNLF